MNYINGVGAEGTLPDAHDLYSEPVFLNVYGAQELTLRNEFHQPMQPGGPVR